MNDTDYIFMLDVLESEKYFANDTFVPSLDEIIDAKSKCGGWNIEDAPTVLGRQYKSTILTLYPLLCHIKKYTNNNVVFISQTDPKLLSFYNNNHSRIFHLINTNLINKAKVLVDLNTEYRAHSKAKYYFVCVENLNTMLKLYHQVVSAQVEKKAESLHEESVTKLIPLYPFGVSFDSRLQIHQDYSDSEATEALLKAHPCIPYYANLVKQLNSIIIRGEEKIRIETIPHRSPKGKITKLSIRAYSEVCSFKSIEKQKEKSKEKGIEFVVDPNTTYREYYLAERFGEWEEYDIKGSVPRVSRAKANKGDMGDLREDIYRVIFEPFIEDYSLYIDSSVTQWCPRVRRFFKSIFMRLFFGGTPTDIQSCILAFEAKQIEKAKKRDESLPTPIFSNLTNSGVDLLALITKWQQKVFEICCRSQSKKTDTSVFLDESCIYLEVRKELAKRGIDVVQVFDGFFFKKGTMPSDMDAIVQESAYAYFGGNPKFQEYIQLTQMSDAMGSLPLDKRADILREVSLTTPSEISAEDMVELNVKYIKPTNKNKK